MRLADRFLNFAARLKKNGASFLDSEPDALPSLVRAARHDVDEMAAALYAPIAPETWAIPGQLAAADPEASAPNLRFRRPLVLGALRPSVIPVEFNPDLRTPTLDDLMVRITVENERSITQGTGALTTVQNNQYVVLADFNVDTPRLVMRYLPQPDPSLQISFRWRLADPSAYATADIKLDLFTRYLSREEIAQYPQS